MAETCFTMMKKYQQCHISEILEMHTHLSHELLDFLREMRRLWRGMCISREDGTSPVVDDRISQLWVPRLSREVRHLYREMYPHLQNLGYVTLLKIFLGLEKKRNSILLRIPDL